MSASTADVTSPRVVKYGPAFWERLWRTSGVQFAAFFVVVSAIYGYQPQIGASADALAQFYDGHRTRILIAAALGGLNVLNLMWFAAALRSTLADAGQDGWGAAATASSAAFGAMYLTLIAISATLAYSAADPAARSLAPGVNGFAWAVVVLSSFPRAMLIMSAAFGLWRAGLISNALFAVGVAAVVLGVLGGTTWIPGSAWSPDGLYSRFVCPAVGLAWLLIVSRVLLTRGVAARPAW
jgi:hypothetical protein